MNPYLPLMDCTYKTNRFGMPLLDIVGITATNTTFYVGFAFPSDEKQPSYQFSSTTTDNKKRWGPLGKIAKL
jgi:MULE transposase domain